jgi:hypothetical protein
MGQAGAVPRRFVFEIRRRRVLLMDLLLPLP